MRQMIYSVFYWTEFSTGLNDLILIFWGTFKSRHSQKPFSLHVENNLDCPYKMMNEKIFC